MTYYAKTAANGHQTTVEEHCTAVANMAKQFGAEIGREKEACLAGLFHDFGKYGARFQEVLRGTRHHVDHAICGASILFQKYGRRSNWAVLEAVNGHHDGLLERAQLEARLRENIQNERPIENDAGKYGGLAGKEEYEKGLVGLLGESRAVGTAKDTGGVWGCAKSNRTDAEHQNAVFLPGRCRLQRFRIGGAHGRTGGRAVGV